MVRLLAAVLTCCGPLTAAGCMSDPVSTASIGASPNDRSGNAPAYPNRPGFRQPGFER